MSEMAWYRGGMVAFDLETTGVDPESDRRHHGIALAEAEEHTSVGDALAAVRLAWKLAHLYPQCADLELLQKRQAYWHAAWADNFESYLRRQGKQESISRDWPIRSLVEGADDV